MKKKYFLLIIIVASVFYTGCKKEEPNQTPTCEITAPANGQEIKKGESITISVYAEDEDGSIAEVRFIIDGVEKSSATSFPYTYIWNTENESLRNHTIKATSFDNDCGSISDDICVTIIAGGSAPVADFTSDITTGNTPLTVNFTDQSANTPSGWQWDFGDGGTSTQQNPSHIYTNDGSYTVTLTVNNQYGSDTKTKNNYIYVGDGGQPCPGTPTIIDADGNVYNTVQIGGQCWMKENLRVGTRINGSQNMTNNGTVEKSCYDDNPTNCETYGGLYQWGEMMQYSTTAGTQGICPNGWHIPTDEDWKTMEMALGMSQSTDDWGWRGTHNEGGKLKEIGTTHWWSSNTGGINSSGFTALPGGSRGNDGFFYGLGGSGRWWSSSEGSATIAWDRGLDYDYDQVYRGYDSKTNGFSIRCIKN